MDRPEPCELAEIVFEKPLAGMFEEILFGSDAGNTLWVKFSDKDGCGEWIGKFEVGGFGSGHAIKVESPDKFLVSAGGFAYLIDATVRTVLKRYHDENARDIVYDHERKALIVADYTKLNWVDFEGSKSFSKGIAVDGIRDLKVENSILSGFACSNYGADEEKFFFDLNSLKVIRWEKISKELVRKRSWWKFWWPV